MTDGATTDFAGSAATRATIDATNDVIAFVDLVQNVAQLETQNAQPIDGPFYDCIVHPHTIATLLQDSTFVTLFTREGGASLRSGYLGTILNLKIFVSSNARTYAGTACTTVYDMLFIARDSYAVAGLAGLVPNYSADAGGDVVRGGMTGKNVKVVEIKVKGLGETGFDPLDQRGTVGWKTTHSLHILQANWLRNLEHATDFS